MKSHTQKLYRRFQISHSTHTALALLFSLTLTACETPVFTKAGSEHLLTGDQIILNNGSLDEARAAYEQALNSSYPQIKGQAYYNLSIIAKEQGFDELPYLEQAASEGHAPAKLELAEIYKRQGPSRREDVERLSLELTETSSAANVNLIEIARARNDEQAAAQYAAQAEQILLTQIYADDEGGKKSLMLGRLYANYPEYFSDSLKAEYYYRSAIEDGNVRAVQELAEYWNTPGPHHRSPDDIFALMIQGAEAGNNAAIKYVAQAYETGNGVAQDANKAMSWSAKVQGGRIKTDTLSRLAQPHIQNNPAKAIPLLQKAAEQGSSEAKLFLYGLNAPGISQDPKDYAGNDPDLLFTSVVKLEKIYGKSNPKMMERLYKLAVDSGSGKAALYMANKPGQDEATKNRWYEKAAEAGHPKAMMTVARHYKIGGNGQAPDEALAFKWFEKAAQTGNPEGEYETGLAYARGTGVEKDTKKAKEWLEKAKANGYVLAIEYLNSLN